MCRFVLLDLQLVIVRFACGYKLLDYSSGLLFVCGGLLISLFVLLWVCLRVLIFNSVVCIVVIYYVWICLLDSLNFVCWLLVWLFVFALLSLLFDFSVWS